jgi:outer membrane protein assembly factor BamE (lipoprotein component of BamABCDE complex)
MENDMRTRIPLAASRWLLAAGLALGVAAAQAARGYDVRHEQESQVQVGMSQAEVQQALGRPAHVERYRNEPGPTWTYDVIGSQSPPELFEVDFGADGKVASVDERVEMLH